MANKDLWGGLLQGFAQARQAKLDRAASEEEKKLKIKLFKQQLEEDEKQKAALDKLQGLMRGVGAPEGPMPARSLLDILADPEGQSLALQSGMKVQDIMNIQQQGNVNKILEGQMGAPGGMELSGIKFDTSGKPMLDFERNKVDKWVPSESGMEMIGLDQAGKQISTRPAGPGEIPKTKGQDAVDTAFAKDYAEFVAGGGIADIQKQIGQLREVRNKLDKQNLTGPIIGNTPDSVLQFTNPEAVASRDAVEEVVQRNLRLILGAQFTEKEGTRLIARAYNPKLSEEENKKRLDRLMKQIEQAAEQKISAAKYFEQNGTLKGWKGKLMNANDIMNMDFSGSVDLSPEDEALVNKYLNP